MESIEKLNKDYSAYRLEQCTAAAIYTLLKEKCKISSSFAKCVENPNKSFSECIRYVFQVDIKNAHDAFSRAIKYYTEEVI